jgi:hypothetical protein
MVLNLFVKASRNKVRIGQKITAVADMARGDPETL